MPLSDANKSSSSTPHAEAVDSCWHGWQTNKADPCSIQPTSAGGPPWMHRESVSRRLAGVVYWL